MKGLSYQNGVIFIGREHAGWAEWNKDGPAAAVIPLTFSSITNMLLHVFRAMPLWYRSIGALLMCSVIVPFVLQFFIEAAVPGLPFYGLLYFLMGTHFFFPKELRQFHGAEHKIFSFKGIKKGRNLYRIRRSFITNRYCSTNTVVLYFLLTAVGFLVTLPGLSWMTGLAAASYTAFPLSMVLHRIIQLPSMKSIRYPVLFLSYMVQRRISCAEPDRRHLRTALEAYRALAEKEFPHVLEEKKPDPPKEVDQMAIVDITVVPVGTASTSISEDVAAMQQVLDNHSEKINSQLTPMGTVLEGKLEDLLSIVKELHEIPFQRGAARVSTNIRIDDRRDAENHNITEKLTSVENKQ
ncbi:MTH1187 family thiamine-binding protein [Salibacterium lacus]|uniref:MTH1187 family thiamine-binding protein n=1 Tax=Salibacterium lacus TaxID=1898109 RepID=A0ABW5SY69_9BACI